MVFWLPDRRERLALSRAAHRPGGCDPAGAVAFAAGMVILVTGLVLRGWSFKTTLGDRYRCYASQHKRLVPLIW